MNNLFLVLHKVRGEPAFDVAEAVLIDEEEAWIIPTSGHRAYPCKAWALDGLAYVDDINNHGFHNRPIDFTPDLTKLLDHYQQPKVIRKTTASTLLAELGLGPKPIPRRKI